MDIEQRKTIAAIVNRLVEKMKQGTVEGITIEIIALINLGNLIADDKGEYVLR